MSRQTPTAVGHTVRGILRVLPWPVIHLVLSAGLAIVAMLRWAGEAVLGVLGVMRAALDAKVGTTPWVHPGREQAGKAMAGAWMIVIGPECSGEQAECAGEGRGCGKEQTMDVRVTVGKRRKIRTSFVDAHGRTVPMDGPAVWSSTNETAVVVAPIAGTNDCWIRGVDQGNALVTVEVDAKLGEEVVPLAKTLSVGSVFAQAQEIIIDEGPEEVDPEFGEPALGEEGGQA